MRKLHWALKMGLIGMALLGLATLGTGCCGCAKHVAWAPPMGWNSYDAFSYGVTESEVKANADYMAEHLKSSGWQYIIVDYVWSEPKQGPTFAVQQDAQFNPRLNMDAYGRLMPDETRFPSAQGGKGFKALAAYVHGKGLKFGIHLMRGVPRQAVAANTPIYGSKATAAGVANTDPADACKWLNQMWGLDMSKPGAQDYLNSCLDMYASWGVDFIKIDDLSSPIFHGAELEGYRSAITHAGRKMVLSTSPGPTLVANAASVTQNANMWRLLGDLWDNWPELNAAFEIIARWAPYSSTDHWPDPDMLPLGKLRVFGPPTGPRDSMSRLTDNEKQTLLTLWTIARCPLMFGGDLPQTDAATLKLITNTEVLAVDQRAVNDEEIVGGVRPVWISTPLNTNDKYLAVFNRTTEDGATPVRLSDLGVKKAKVRDLWTHQDLGEMTETFAPALGAHGAGLYKLTAIETMPRTKPAPEEALPAVRRGRGAPGTAPAGATPPAAAQIQSYEAESKDNEFGPSVTVDDEDVGGKASGGHYVGYLGSGAEQILRFKKIHAERAGTYTLTIYYMSGEDRSAYVAVNGGEKKMIDFASSGGFSSENMATVKMTIQLNAGDNTIEMGNADAFAPDIDRITIKAAQ